MQHDAIQVDSQVSVTDTNFIIDLVTHVCVRGSRCKAVTIATTFMSVYIWLIFVARCPIVK